MDFPVQFALKRHDIRQTLVVSEIEQNEKSLHYGEPNILALNVLGGIFYSADQLPRTKVSSTTRLDNTFTPAIFHSINNLYCQKPHSKLHLDSTKRENETYR